ncbi:MAG: energy transducer TonB, partial [Erythrobacter sp.]
ITDSDYRPSWINRNYSGRAGFTLTIDRNGKVDTCRITRSTGHSALDEATCRLLERRATFEPAKDGSGKKVAGTFSSSVNWRIPN